MSGQNTNLTPYAGLNASGSVLLVKVQSEVVVWNGNPNGILAGQSGSAFAPPDRVWDYTNKQEYVCTLGGSTISTAWTPIVQGSFSTPVVNLEVTGSLIDTGSFQSQDSTLMNYFNVTPVGPTDVTVGNNAQIVGNLSMSDVGGSGQLSTAAFVLNDLGDPGRNSYACQLIYTYQGTVGSTAITGSGALLQAARASTVSGTEPTIVGALSYYVDSTTKKSSLTGPSYGHRIVFVANDVDDGENRRLLDLSLERNGLTGADVVVDAAITVGGETSHHSFNDVLRFTGVYNLSCMNSVNATETSGGNAVWIGEGQHIGLDSASGGSALARIFSDGANVSTTVPIRPNSYLVSALPTPSKAQSGAVAFASNARNTGEGGGAGTGCPVFINSSGDWVSVWSGVAPTT